MTCALLMNFCKLMNGKYRKKRKYRWSQTYMIVQAPASMQENPHSGSIDPMQGARLEFPRSYEHRFKKSATFWNGTSYSFETKNRLSFRDGRITHSSKTSVEFYGIARCCNPEDHIFHGYAREKPQIRELFLKLSNELCNFHNIT